MTITIRHAFAATTSLCLTAALAGRVAAQDAASTDAASLDDPGADPGADSGADPGAEASAPAPAGPRPPGRGDLDAGGQVRLPSGPDEMGQFASFHWVAVDLQGKYYLLDSVTVNATMPVALIKPEALPDGTEPSMFGGAAITLDARLPKLDLPLATRAMKDTDLGVTLTAAYMRQGAMLLGPRDYPLFTGGFEPGVAAGLTTKVKLGSVVDLRLLPQILYQRGETEAANGVQVPMSLIVKLGSLLAVSADLAVNTGDDYALGADDGGRIALGAAIDVKLGPIATHLGAGLASLLTGGAYPTIRDSMYFDINVKYQP